MTVFAVTTDVTAGFVVVDEVSLEPVAHAAASVTNGIIAIPVNPISTRRRDRPQFVFAMLLLA
ncbi:hypothetical protein [Nocardia sp. NPDC004722]